MVCFRNAAVLASLLSIVAGTPIPAPRPAPTPPGIPSASSAETQLNELEVAEPGSMDGYSREEFDHWHIVSGQCNTRETVLKRDGRNVQQDSKCAATSGTWVSPFDGATWTAASDVDIDHMIPLANAWRSGASSWTAARREQFANELTLPQLWAVTDDVNSDKSDSSPDKWKPPLTSFHCTYARSWIVVKHAYGLTVTDAEKSALASMLGSC